MKWLSLFAFLLFPTIAASGGVDHIRLSDFSGVRHVKISDFLKPIVKTPEVVEDPFAEMYERAVKARQPLYVWVDYWCPSSQQLVQGFHYRVNSRIWNESTGPQVQGPAVVKLIPEPGGRWLQRDGVINAKDCCAASLANGGRVTGTGSRASGGG